MVGRRRKSLTDVLTASLAADPHDAPFVYLEVDIMADDMARYAPTAVEPTRTDRTDHADHGIDRRGCRP